MRKSKISATGDWALILGASSGFGAATAKELARHGFNIFGVHLDRKATLKNAEEVIEFIKNTGKEAVFFNINAADDKKRKKVMDEIENIVKSQEDDAQVRVLMHSLAFGTLKTFFGEDKITSPQLMMTLEVMANTLVYWAQDLVERGLMRRGGRIFAMTSSGSQKVMKYYGAVSAAKCALESHIRQLALELAPLGITANAIRAGVTDTPALRKIPGHEQIIELVLRINPSGRLTTPEDVAKTIAVLTHPDLYWMTGNAINVDGGENISGI